MDIMKDLGVLLVWLVVKAVQLIIVLGILWLAFSLLASLGGFAYE
jgi:hypothetical protein